LYAFPFFIIAKAAAGAGMAPRNATSCVTQESNKGLCLTMLVAAR